jgi:hypothetical protein
MKNQTVKQDAILTRKKLFECGSGNAEGGSGNAEWGMGNAEGGSGNVEVGMRKLEMIEGKK